MSEVIDILGFQTEAINTISRRFQPYFSQPIRVGPEGQEEAIPFYQDLAAMTGAGKTVILAGLVRRLHEWLSPQASHPVILWLSRARVVVDQSFDNLSEGGRYNHLLGSCNVQALADYKLAEVRDSEQAMLFFATVGTFNQEQKGEGALSIFKPDIDTLGGTSLWTALKARVDSHGRRRPLLVVYDEGHNLSDQQTRLLLELEPTALIFASATMRRSKELHDKLQILRGAGWRDSDDEDAEDLRSFSTKIDGVDVVEEQLIKSDLAIGAYQQPMEVTLDAMLAALAKVESAAADEGLDTRPKAIYVSDTNVLEDGDKEADRKLPFTERQARPIVIWRYLVERRGIPPDSIAVLGDLKFDKDHPPPVTFNLFRGDRGGYDEFRRGDFRHILFNKALLEGWDDPEVYCAYIDKSMGSDTNIRQVIGRVLRQPHRRHAERPELNSAQLFVRLDDVEGQIHRIVADIQREVSTSYPGVGVRNSSPGAPANEPAISPLKDGMPRRLPILDRDTIGAIQAIQGILRSFPDLRLAGEAARASSRMAKIQISVGSGDEQRFEWEECPSSFPVRVRWRLRTCIREEFPQVATALDPTLLAEDKFDALVELGSAADLKVQETAHDIVEAYKGKVCLISRDGEGYTVGPSLGRGTEARFSNALHESYRGLNPSELEFARELERTDCVWCRNGVQARDKDLEGWEVPLIAPGANERFYPDFLVWGARRILAIDPTGDVFVPGKLRNKLLITEQHGFILILVSDGRWDVQGGELCRVPRSSGHSLLYRHPQLGSVIAEHHKSLRGVVEACLRMA
jgi:type III restriction enzyme